MKENSFDKILLENSKDSIKIYNIKKFESNVQINTEYNMNDILDKLNPKLGRI